MEIIEGQKDRRRAYEVGTQAFKDGVPRSDIPSWNLELVNCWRDGWDDEAAQASLHQTVRPDYH